MDVSQKLKPMKKSSQFCRMLKQNLKINKEDSRKKCYIKEHLFCFYICVCLLNVEFDLFQHNFFFFCNYSFIYLGQYHIGLFSYFSLWTNLLWLSGQMDKIIPENGPDMLNSSYIHMYLVRWNRELAMAQVLFMLKQVPKSLKTAITGSKRRLLLGRKAIIKPESMLKRRDITLPKKSPCSHARMWVLDHKCQQKDAFQLWCWRRLLRVPWIAKISNQSILKNINPEYSLLKLKLPFFGHLMLRAGSLEKALMLGKIEGRRRSRQQKMS